MGAQKQVSSSSTSERDQKYAAILDEKKRKRMVSNRESARRSRMRKKKLLEDLRDEVTHLQSANSGVMAKIDEATEMYRAKEAENRMLRAQATELSEKLRSLNNLLENCGVNVEIPKIPEILLEPWKPPCPLQPIITPPRGILHF